MLYFSFILLERVDFVDPFIQLRYSLAFDDDLILIIAKIMLLCFYEAELDGFANYIFSSYSFLFSSLCGKIFFILKIITKQIFYR